MMRRSPLVGRGGQFAESDPERQSRSGRRFCGVADDRTVFGRSDDRVASLERRLGSKDRQRGTRRGEGRSRPTEATRCQVCKDIGPVEARTLARETGRDDRQETRAGALRRPTIRLDPLSRGPRRTVDQQADPLAGRCELGERVRAGRVPAVPRRPRASPLRPASKRPRRHAGRTRVPPRRGRPCRAPRSRRRPTASAPGRPPRNRTASRPPRDRHRTPPGSGGRRPRGRRPRR